MKPKADFASLDPTANIDVNSRNLVTMLLERLVASLEDSSIGLLPQTRDCIFSDRRLRRDLLDQLRQRSVVDLPMIPFGSSLDLVANLRRVRGFEPRVTRTPCDCGGQIG